MIGRQMLNLIVLALLALSCGWGQSLEVGSSKVNRGSGSSFPIVLSFPAGKAPAALQWELIFPSGIIAEAAGMAIGGAAQRVGKSLTCVAKKGDDAGATFACIVAG